MDLIAQQKYEKELIDEIIEAVDFDGDGINAMEKIVHEWVQTKTTYTRECKFIVEAFDYDIFEIDENFQDRPRSWVEAAEYALYGMWYSMDFDIKDINNYKNNT